MSFQLKEKEQHHSHDHEEHHHHHHHDHEHKGETLKTPPVDTPRNPNLWMEAILSTLLISAAPFAILFWIPLDNSKEKEGLLKILLSFASGGLLGDAFLHLIPHAILAQGGDDDGHGHSHSHSHSHSHGKAEGAQGDYHAHDLSVGMWVLIGIITFLVVEKVIRIMKGGHGHSHSVSTPKKSEPEDKQKSESAKGKKKDEGKVQTKSGVIFI